MRKVRLQRGFASSSDPYDPSTVRQGWPEIVESHDGAFARMGMRLRASNTMEPVSIDLYNQVGQLVCRINIFQHANHVSMDVIRPDKIMREPLPERTDHEWQLTLRAWRDGIMSLTERLTAGLISLSFDE